MIILAASSDVPVLIMGESGSGKELIARAIHNDSLRRDQPLVPVNCAAVPADLFESEFFGHTSGAFTGAVRERPGRFGAAQRGTLFLDEVTEMPTPLQAKLLRALDQGTIQRVGEDEEHPVDVRVIASTNRDVRHELDTGRLRADLYYRLSVVRIHVPPLCARREDIPWLAQHFLTQRRPSATEAMLSARARSLLLAHDWPGNVRELFNVLEMALLLSKGDELRVDLALEANREVRPPPSTDVFGGRVLPERELLRIMRQNTIEALRRTGWKIAGPDGAAALLGVKPSTLVSRVKRWRISRGSEERGDRPREEMGRLGIEPRTY
jgi:transcriptional regulator with GAF, ATPase, and Fis domain